ncbi:MAG: DNA polymerase III subunit delta [Pseudolabrys sp.]|nr:DNA polymerase III subunit delta [Pseudolabrys sp.]
MTAVRAADIDKFVAKPNPAQPVVLVYGPDAGLVRERVDALIRVSVDDPNDPFALARIESEELSSNPGKLADEANTVPLFGGRRAVLLRVNSRHNIVPSVEAVLDAPPRDCRIVIEAGELRKNAPLRAACEKAKTAATLACYVDNERDLARLIDEEMNEADLTLAPDPRAALLGLLGGDRLASRGEVRKLALYVSGKTRIELEDVLAIVSDASALSIDDAVDATFAGRVSEVEIEYHKARQEGTAPGTIVSAALRQVAQLHKMRLALDDGSDIESVMMRGTPPVHFSRRPQVETVLRIWTPARLMRAMAQLAEASLEARRQPIMAEAIAQRALLALAGNARRRE